MRKIMCVLIVFATLGLCACVNFRGRVRENGKETVAKTEKEEVIEELEELEETKELEKTEEPKAKHSEFYIEGYSVEKVLQYYNEVVLLTEFSTGEGNPFLVQRWNTPIHYHITGSPTDEDLRILNGLFAELNKVNGFPGISEARNSYEANLNIYFYGRQEFNNRFAEFVQSDSADGAVQYWYETAGNNIYTADIGYCTDMSPEIRRSVLLEEVVNGLGLGDSVLREDSIVYQYSSSVTNLSKVDWLIIKLMYHPKIRCGMDVAQCESVIRELYY